MKTKLLKKIRKRFEIHHYPNKDQIIGESILGEMVVLCDNGKKIKFREVTGEDTINKIIEDFRKIILKRVNNS